LLLNRISSTIRKVETLKPIYLQGFTPDVNVWEVVFSKSGEFKTVAKAFDLAGHTSGVHDFGFSADTGHMATVSKDGTYRFYNTKSSVTIHW